MREEPINLFGLMIPWGTEAGTVEYTELHAAGLSIPDAKPVYIIITFQGQMLGLQVPPGASAEHRVMVTADNAAVLAAVVIGYGEQAAGRVPFTAMLDQALSRVRATIKNGDTPSYE